MFSSIRATAVLAVATVALLSGCSGNTSSTTLPGGNTSTIGPAGLSEMRSASGVARSARPYFEVIPATNDAFQNVAVSNYGSATVDIFGDRLKLRGTVTNGVQFPAGVWVDGGNNLYVTDDTDHAEVLEYAQGSSTPTATYSSELREPLQVTTDGNANVYVADNLAGVVEYAQDSNSVMNACSRETNPESVAVDASGDVFVGSDESPKLAEYIGGLAGCKEIALAPNLGEAGGLAIAGDQTLLALDQKAGVVDVIPPPYSSITSQIMVPGNAPRPFSIAVSKYNHYLYVVDLNNEVLDIFNYPAGTLFATMTANIDDPVGVAVYPRTTP